MKNVQYKELDKEWIALILQAKQLGLTTEEVRVFILGKEVKSMMRQNKDDLFFVKQKVYNKG